MGPVTGICDAVNAVSEVYLMMNVGRHKICEIRSGRRTRERLYRDIVTVVCICMCVILKLNRTYAYPR